jgi:hypothetical protein
MVANVLEACDRHTIAINTVKVQFCQPKVHFGGFVVSHGIHVNLCVGNNRFLSASEYYYFFQKVATKVNSGLSRLFVVFFLDPIFDINSKNTVLDYL